MTHPIPVFIAAATTRPIKAPVATRVADPVVASRRVYSAMSAPANDPMNAPITGPTIGIGAYEVGLDFRARFTDQDAENARFFRAGARADRTMFDLPAYIVARLERLGLRSVADLALCTYSDEARFFSYRRTTHRAEPDYGRQISAIALAP